MEAAGASQKERRGLILRSDYVKNVYLHCGREGVVKPRGASLFYRGGSRLWCRDFFFGHSSCVELKDSQALSPHTRTVTVAYCGVAGRAYTVACLPRVTAVYQVLGLVVQELLELCCAASR